MSIFKSVLSVLIAKIAMGFLVLIGLVATIAHLAGADVGAEVDAFFELLIPLWDYFVNGIQRLFVRITS